MALRGRRPGGNSSSFMRGNARERSALLGLCCRALPPQEEDKKKQGFPASQQEEASNSRSSSKSAEELERVDIDKQLEPIWQDIKRELKRDADPELRQLLDEVSYEELLNSEKNGFFQRLAEAKLGPYLAAMGVDRDPLAFFSEVVKLALFLQFMTCGFLFYSCELIGHLNTGDALRATLGMTLGYISRPFFKMEALLYPIYNAVLKVALPDAIFEVPASSRQAMYSTINSIGVALAAAFLLPQVLLGWGVEESTQLVAPLTLGWLLFDISYISSLLLVMQRDTPER